MIRFLSSLVVLAAVILFGLYTLWLTPDLPNIDIESLKQASPNKWTQVLASNGQTPILSYGKYRHQHVALANVSQDFKDALLATEDRRFYQHNGVDLYGIARAMLTNITQGSIRQGASTLTQQLSRNVFLNNQRSLKRKLQEILLSIELEKKLTKDEILELYINHIYFGEGAYGIYAASEIFFNKKPNQLTTEEAALIAGLPQAPSSLNPFYHKERSLKRRNEVLTNLFEVGKLDKKTLDTLKAKPIIINPNGRLLSEANRAPFFNQMVVQKVRHLLELDEQAFWQSGLKIVTTLDSHAQRLAQQTIHQYPRLQTNNKHQLEASLLSIEPQTGKIRAYVGGTNFARSQFDRVNTALRAPGSLFKVFTYTAAIEKGFKPDRVYLDEPIKAGKWEPKNYDKKYNGYMTLSKAFVKSNNIVSVKVMHEITPDKVIQVAKRMGVQSKLASNLALTLGSSSMTLIDVTSSIGTLANKGLRCEPYGIEKIMDKNGNVLYEHYRIETQALDQKTVDQMIKMMEAVVKLGTGRGAHIGRPVAGKTGTSDDHRDGWFVGFTPQMITGVWMGYDNNTSVWHLSGGGDPAVVWAKYMRALHAGKKVDPFHSKYGEEITPELMNTINLDNISPLEAHHPLAIGDRPLPTSGEPELESDPLLEDENGHPILTQEGPIGPPAPGQPSLMDYHQPATRPLSGAPTQNRPPNPLSQGIKKQPYTINPHPISLIPPSPPQPIITQPIIKRPSAPKPTIPTPKQRAKPHQAAASSKAPVPPTP